MKLGRHNQPQSAEHASDEWLASLGDRPFVALDRIAGPKTVQKDQEVPLSRVVAGALGRDSWIPEGMKRLQDGTLVPSADYVKQLARERAYVGSNNDPLRVAAFYDNQGGEWYMVDSGRHRVTAAMLNNEPSIIADILRTQVQAD